MVYSLCFFSILGVEQGEQGFVKNLIGRHETIKSKGDEELEERRKSRVYSSSDQLEGVVPTRSTSFANVDKPEVCDPVFCCCFKVVILARGWQGCYISGEPEKISYFSILSFPLLQI